MVTMTNLGLSGSSPRLCHALCPFETSRLPHDSSLGQIYCQKGKHCFVLGPSTFFGLLPGSVGSSTLCQLICSSAISRNAGIELGRERPSPALAGIADWVLHNIECDYSNIWGCTNRRTYLNGRSGKLLRLEIQQPHYAVNSRFYWIELLLRLGAHI